MHKYTKDPYRREVRKAARMLGRFRRRLPEELSWRMTDRFGPCPSRRLTPTSQRAISSPDDTKTFSVNVLKSLTEPRGGGEKKGSTPQNFRTNQVLPFILFFFFILHLYFAKAGATSMCFFSFISLSWSLDCKKDAIMSVPHEL